MRGTSEPFGRQSPIPVPPDECRYDACGWYTTESLFRGRCWFARDWFRSVLNLCYLFFCSLLLNRKQVVYSCANLLLLEDFSAAAMPVAKRDVGHGSFS